MPITRPQSNPQQPAPATRQRQERAALVWCVAPAPGLALAMTGLFADPGEAGLLAWAQAHWWIALVGGALAGAAFDISTRIRAWSHTR